MSKGLIVLEKVVSKVLMRDNISLRLEMTAPDVEGWDSLNHVQIIFTLEEELGIQFEVREIQNLDTIGNLVELINKYIEK